MAQAVGHDPIVNRYVEAIMGLANEAGNHDQWVADLDSLAELAGHPEAVAYLSSDTTAGADKEQFLARVLDISPLAMNVARLLVSRGRLQLAPRIAEVFTRALDRQRGIASVQVTTAVPLSPDAAVDVERRMRELTGATEVRISTRVDPSIMGGMIARVGDRLIDGSTRTRLIQLRRALAGEAR